MFQVQKGVHGFVQDKSGKAISKATIVLNEGLRVYTKEGGYFHVLLAPGLHNIDAMADGYQPKHVKVCECLYRRALPVLPSWPCVAAGPQAAVLCLHQWVQKDFPAQWGCLGSSFSFRCTLASARSCPSISCLEKKL